MTDITQHEWNDSAISVEFSDGERVILATSSVRNEVVADDARALAEHFGLLPAIRPLEWHGEIKEAHDSISARTRFGTLSVKYLGDDTYFWGYCFDEYYDEDEFPCLSEKDGKAEAEKFWLEQVAEILNTPEPPK